MVKHIGLVGVGSWVRVSSFDVVCCDAIVAEGKLVSQAEQLNFLVIHAVEFYVIFGPVVLDVDCLHDDRKIHVESIEGSQKNVAI